MVFCSRFIEVGGVLSIIAIVLAGAAIFGLGILLSKAFSREDRGFIREALSGLAPGPWGKRRIVKGNPVKQQKTEKIGRRE